MTTQTKGIYHSRLEELTEEHGGVWVALKKRPSDSSRNKDMAGFVTITDWNQQERYINIENEAVLAALQAAPVGEWIQLKAGGMRENAWLQVFDRNGNQIGGGRAQSPAQGAAPSGPPPSGPPPTHGSGDPSAQAGPGMPPSQAPAGPSPNQQPAQDPPANEPPLGGRSLAAIYYECLQAATDILAQDTEQNPIWYEEMTNEQFMTLRKDIATHLAIGFSQNDGRAPIRKEPDTGEES